MALCHRRVLVSEHHRYGVADDVTAPKYDRGGSCDLDAGAFKEFDYCGRSAWGKERLSCARREVADVVRVETERYEHKNL